MKQMFCAKICLIFVFLTICKAETEKDDIQDFGAGTTISLPSALQFSESKQSHENDILQSVSVENMEDPDNQADKANVSSVVEVFKDTSGPTKGKQEEEEVEAQDTPPGDEETPPNEETEADTTPDTEPAPATEEVGTPLAQTEDEAAAASQVESATEGAANDEEAATAETENAVEAANETEKETTQPNDVSNVDVEPAGNNEAQMPNDEPAKEEEENEKPDLTKVSDEKNMDRKEATCFTCASNEDANCAIKATKEIKCPRVSEGDAGKHNGCYTLYQADTNTTMRGCVDDLAETGLKYCLTNEKLCSVCYKNSCNDKLAPSKAAKLYLDNYILMILNISSLILIKCAILKFYKF